MKLTSIITILLCVSFTTNAQKVIENPKFSATTASNVKIVKIMLTDTATILGFEVKSTPKTWISIPKETYIINSKGGEKLYVKSAEGIVINEEHWTPESGVNIYTLFFPPLEKSIETIDYLETQWKIFDIELVPRERFSIFPDELLGNWIRTDGSNEWVYGFFDEFVIFKNEIWKQVLINQKEDSYKLLLQKNGKKEQLVIKKSNNNLLIGLGTENLELFSKIKTSTPDYVIPNNEEFQTPIFKKGNAIYKGLLKGYHPKMGETGMVYVNNLLSNDQTSHLITIEPDGTFYAEFPMLYPQEAYVKILGFYDVVFFEPDKTTFQVIDLSGQNQNKSPFMGEMARINTDLNALKYIKYFDYNNSRSKMLDMTGEDYKTYCLDILQKEQKELDDFIGRNKVCKKAIQIKQMKIQFSMYQTLLSYNMNRESAYRQKHNTPRDQREIPLERQKFEPVFYDFIDAGELNNPLSVLTGGDYYFSINRLKFADPVRQRSISSGNSFGEILKEFEFRNIKLEPEEIELFNKLDKSESDKNRMEIIKSDSLLYADFLEKYKDVYKEISLEIIVKKREKFQQEAFSKYFNLQDGFAIDVMKAQDYSGTMKSSFKPLNENEKVELTEKISNEFIVNYLLETNRELEEEIALKKEANKHKTAFVVNETPEANEGDVFDAIMEKYKGNLVYVDFWATWCGPCRAGMKRIKPLKEELKDKKIKFVYITNPSSPKETYDMMIPDINGEHYRVTDDEWNKISARFKIGGIPHYVLVDNEGKVVKDKIYFASSNVELKKLFNEYLDD